MLTDRFSYDLPEERIAQHPLPDRDAARMLVVRAHGAIDHCHVGELAELIEPGTLMVLNDTRVLPARLLGEKVGTRGKVELLLVQRVDGDVWKAMGRASKGLHEGHTLEFGVLSARIKGRGEDGLLVAELFTADASPVDAAIQAIGHVPLPPYIHRPDDIADRERYQTVFARHGGSIAAPTAGLHMSEGLLARLANKGCEVAFVTLHVGLGTFQPVTVSDLDAHPMHAERMDISHATAEAVRRARERGRPVLAVGTTVVRALETAADPHHAGHILPISCETRLLIQPGYAFRVVDRLLTNFHLPRSTLLALVCAFAKTDTVLAAYETAVREGYRFYSYGDAMLLSRAAAGV